MPNKTIWSYHVKDYLKQRVNFITDEQLAKEISSMVGRPVTISAVRNERYKLGLIKEGGRGKTTLRSKDGKIHPTKEQ